MSILSELINAYAEGQGVKEWGPDWRERIELLRAQANRYNAMGEGTPAKRNLINVQRGDGGVDVLDEATGEKVYSTPGRPAEPGKRIGVSVRGPKGEKMRKLFTEEELAAGVQEWVDPDRPETPKLPDRGTGRQVIINGQLYEWFPETDEYIPARGGAMGMVDARQFREQKGLINTMDELLSASDEELKLYEEQFGDEKGLKRYLPAFVNPQKAVAKNAYLSKLQSIAQIFGRAILRDQRVSNDDRKVYADAIGLNGEIIMTLEPGEARRRMEFMRNLIQKKYGEIAGFGHGGGNVPNLPGPGAPGAPDGGDNFDDICAADPAICGRAR